MWFRKWGKDLIMLPSWAAFVQDTLSLVLENIFICIYFGKSVLTFFLNGNVGFALTLVINYCIYGMSSGCKSHYFGNHNEVHNDFFLFNLFSFVICTVPWMFNQSENFESFSDWLWMLFFLIFFFMSIYLATPLKLLINVT